MTDSGNFSYSYSLKPSDQPRTEPLFAMDMWSETELPDGNILVRNRRNGNQMVLPAEIVSAMSYCTRFRSLAEHVDALMDGGDDNTQRRAGIEAVIRSLQKEGMTLSAQEVLDRLTRTDQVDQAIGKPTLTIMTWERPVALQRLLDSMRDVCDPQGIDRCIVIDDSLDPDNISQNRETTLAADEQAPFRIDYFGAEEATRFLNFLIDQLPEHEESIRFHLDRDRWANFWSCGMSRNYSQLLSVGHPLIVFDDDVVCDVHEAPLTRPGIDFSNYPRQAIFYGSKEEWPPVAPEGQRDPIARQMRYLGLTIAEVLTELGVESLEEGALHNGESVNAERFHPSSRVLICECGSLGDSGTGTNQWLTRLAAESREQLLKEEHIFPRALKVRNCWHGRRQLAFTPVANMSQVSGSDNRDLLPPYFPFNRVEDKLFGQTTSFVFPKALTLDQPWVTPHLPIPEREWTPADNDFVKTVSFPGELIFVPYRLFDSCLHEDPEKRLASLAHHYLDLADCPDQELLELFADGWNRKRSEQLLDLYENIQESVDQGPAWRDYLQKAYRQVETSRLGELSVANLKSHDLNLSGEELLQFWRKAWRSYGQSMLAWPEIREAARRYFA